MKNCTNCNTPIDDNAVFCHNCGTSQPTVGSQQPQQPIGNQQPMGNPQQPMGNPQQPMGNPQQPNANQNFAQPYQMPVSSDDHTAEFSPTDVSENKLFALAVYLLGAVGIIIALISRVSKPSPYLNFHIKQGMKIFISEILVGLLTALLSWTCIMIPVGAIAVIVLAVVSIICFVNTCKGKSVEAPIVKSLKFLD